MLLKAKIRYRPVAVIGRNWQLAVWLTSGTMRKQDSGAKVHPVVAGVIGVAVAIVAFLTVGIQILFSVSYAAVHSQNDLIAGLGILVSWAAVLSVCIWMAVAIKRRISRN